MKICYSLFLILVMGLNGCATVPPSEWSRTTVDQKLEVVNARKVGDESSVKLGAVLVERAAHTVTPTIEFASDWELKAETPGIPAFIVIRGRIATFTSVMQNVSSGKRIECYESNFGWRDHWNYGKARHDRAFLLCETDNGDFVPLRAIDRSLNVSNHTYNNIPKDSPIIRKVDVLSTTPYKLSQLVYGGLAGNSIKLVYREFVSDLSRPSFFQELVFDISASKVVEFRSFRLEVLSSTNQEVRFRVLSPT